MNEILIGFICLFVIWGVVWVIRGIQKDLEALDERVKNNNEQMKKDMDALHEKIRKLEDANKRRMPLRSQDDVLNAMAALDAWIHEAKFGENIIENAKGHLAKSLAVGTKREE